MRAGVRSLKCFLLLLGTIWTWSLASPLFSSPDEPSHVVKAAAVARGDLGAREITAENGRRTYAVKVPEIFARAAVVPACFAFNPTVTPACSVPFRGTLEEQEVITAAGRYPPLYYLAVGLPTAIFPSSTGVYLARLVSGAICALLLAWAFSCASARKGSRLPVLGVLLAVTPMVLYLGGSVNPNGVEISAAVSLWVAALVIVLDDHPERRVLAQAGVSASILVLMRGLSPLWVLLIGLIVLTLGRRDHLRSLLARKDVRGWLALPAACTALAVGWIVLAGVLELQPGYLGPAMGLSEMIRTSIARSGDNIRQMVGLMGWADARPPEVTYLLWFFALGFMIVSAFVLAPRRILLAISFLVMVILVLPVALEVSQAREYGYVWQGRYTLPLAVGLPILAAFGMGTYRPHLPDEHVRRLATVLTVLVAVAHVGAFTWALHRFTVGTVGPLVFLDTRWSPPAPAWLLLGMFIVLSVSSARLYHRLVVNPLLTT